MLTGRAAVRNALRSSERDLREEQIEQNSGGTFGWVYDDDTTGFREWLLSGGNIFWIRGKPGPGKSTSMKYIYHNKRTAQLLHEWGPAGSRAEQMRIGFFFHHRGSDAQRLFSGPPSQHHHTNIGKASPATRMPRPCFGEYL